MATYKYQQNNVNGGASVGYVKYNISPDYGSLLMPGDTITITGQAYWKNKAIREIWITINMPYNLSQSVSRRISVNIPKDTAKTFTIEYTLPELPMSWSSDRLLSLQLQFSLMDSTGSGDGYEETTVKRLSYLRYRVSFAAKNVQFERYSLSEGSYRKDDEGTCVMGSLALSISEGRSASDIATATVDITDDGGGHQTLTIPANVLTAALTPNGYIETAPSLFSSIAFSTAHNYTLTFTIGDDYDICTFSVLIARAFVNVHLSGCRTGGVAFGKFSGATEDHPMFECTYPAYFYGGIAEGGIGDHGVTAQQTIGTSSTKSFTIIFSKEFSAPPTVIASVETTEQSLCIPCVHDITTTGCIVGVRNNSTSVSKVVKVHWIAL